MPIAVEAEAGKAEGGGGACALTGLRSVRSRLVSSLGEACADVTVDCVETTDRPDVRRAESTGCASTSPSPRPAIAVAALLRRRGGLEGNGTPESVEDDLPVLESGRGGRSGRSGRSTKAVSAPAWGPPVFCAPDRPSRPRLGLSSSASSGAYCAGSLTALNSAVLPFAPGSFATSCTLSEPSAIILSAGLILNRFVGLTPSLPRPSKPGSCSMRGRPNEYLFGFALASPGICSELGRDVRGVD